MIEWARRQWVALAALAAALAGVLWALLEARHAARAGELRGAADQADERKAGSLHAAHKAAQKADHHSNRAAAAARRGNEAIDKLRKTDHESLADRVADYRDRVRNRP